VKHNATKLNDKALVPANLVMSFDRQYVFQKLNLITIIKHAKTTHTDTQTPTNKQ